MSAEALLGCVLIGLSVAAQLLLVFWSRRRINRIADRKLQTARDIVRGMGHG